MSSVVYNVKRKFNGGIGWLSSFFFIGIPIEQLPNDDLDVIAFLDANPIMDDLIAGGEFVPAEVTKLQLKRTLLAAGLLATVEAYVAAADDDTKMAWADAATMPRDDALVNAAANAMGLDTDALFIAASKL